MQISVREPRNTIYLRGTFTNYQWGNPFTCCQFWVIHDSSPGDGRGIFTHLSGETEFLSHLQKWNFSLSLSLVPNDLCWRTKIDEISFHHPLTFFRGALCSFSIQPMRLPCIFPTKKKLTDKNDVDDDCHDSRGLLMKKLKKNKPEVGDCVHIHFSIQSVYWRQGKKKKYW
jgi:hypothetical protein